MRDYLTDFHKHKDVFLPFRAGKATKSAAKEASRGLRQEHNRLLASGETRPGTPSQRRKLQEEFKLETEELVHDLLTTGADYNFPKMHLISHFADQIEQYGSLPQYSTEICEASHKPLKDAYRRSNHINAMEQIIGTYTRAHSFAMRDRNIEQWCNELEHITGEIRAIVRPTRASLHIPSGSARELTHTILQGRLNLKTIYNIQTLQERYELPDLRTLTSMYLLRNAFPELTNPEPDVERLMDAPLEAFHTLQVAVPTFNDNGHFIHRLRCTGKDQFRGQDQRNDWVFVRRRKPSATKIEGALDGRIPAKLNALFKLRDLDTRITYRLAHITILSVIGSPTPDGPEGMVRVGTPAKNHVVSIRHIEGMAHLVPINPENLYLVNNRIDLDTWNDIHDGN
jgi:hypothetical protein